MPPRSSSTRSTTATASSSESPKLAIGLLRQYFPKGTGLSVYPEKYLDAVAEELNGRPRKALGWRKPGEVFRELVEKAAG